MVNRSPSIHCLSPRGVATAAGASTARNGSKVGWRGFGPRLVGEDDPLRRSARNCTKGSRLLTPGISPLDRSVAGLSFAREQGFAPLADILKDRAALEDLDLVVAQAGGPG